MRENLLKELKEKKNTFLSPDAWDTLECMENSEDIVKKMVDSSKRLPFPIGRDCLQTFVEEGTNDHPVPKKKPDSLKPSSPEEPFDIINDITGNSTCTGCLDDFSKYFKSRFDKLRSILYKRREAKGIIDIRRAKKRKGEAKVIAMVSDISNTSNGNKMITLEDDTGMMRGFISDSSPAFSKNLLEDEVILAIGQVWDGSNGYEVTLSIENIVRPGVPKITSEPAKIDGKIAFIGDIHMGSSTFIEESWNDFIEWMNSDDPTAKDIRYLLISGDLIDGIGIYPNQEDDLIIKDVYEQYRVLAEYIKKLPRDLNIIAIPGNHDVVRNPEPQPSLPEEVQRLFPKNVKFCGNPSLINIKGLNILMYHGVSINDLSDLIPQVDTKNPSTAMKEILDRRHLVPVYGKKTPISPEEEDLLVIEEVPDIFVTGHIHRTDVKKYHGTFLINSSTWQKQTDYQKMRDIQPDPGKVVIFDPSTCKVILQSF